MNRDYPNFGRDTNPQMEWQQWWRKLIAGECPQSICLLGDKHSGLFQSAFGATATRGLSIRNFSQEKLLEIPLSR